MSYSRQLLASVATILFASAISAEDWPVWRGPNHNGIAVGDAPTEWSTEKNVRWVVDVPGKGHGSPIVVGDRVILATADIEQQKQELLCYERSTGKLLWRSVAHQGGLIVEGNKKATLASSTPAVAGQLVFINFLNDHAVHTTAVQLEDGKRVWQTKISNYKVHQGYGSSPIPFGNLVLVSADNKGGGAIAALEQATGKVVWSHDEYTEAIRRRQASGNPGPPWPDAEGFCPAAGRFAALFEPDGEQPPSGQFGGNPGYAALCHLRMRR